MSESGKFSEATKEMAEAVGFYDNMRKLIPAIRAARIQVIIVPHHRWREGDYVGWNHMNPTQVPGEPKPRLRRRKLGRRIPSRIRPARWRRRRARALGAERLRQYRLRRNEKASITEVPTGEIPFL
jgi:hypothetical protein